MVTEKATITPDEAAVLMRANGIKINTETVRDGISQGVFPFGIMIERKERLFLISKKKFSDWMEEFCGSPLILSDGKEAL